MHSIKKTDWKSIPAVWVFLFIGLLVVSYHAGEAAGALAFHLTQ